MIIRMRHLRKAKICSQGARFFFKRHDLDWSDFLKNGIEEEKLIVIDDYFSNLAVEVAHGR